MADENTLEVEQLSSHELVEYLCENHGFTRDDISALSGERLYTQLNIYSYACVCYNRNK